MQIWFYHRECQIGDYVYHDRSTSPQDVFNKTKTIVGICVYIDPYDHTKRWCIALKNNPTYAWGLYPPYWNGGIHLADKHDYSVFDVPTLVNKSETGINGQGGYINDSTYRDTNTIDGFKQFATSFSVGEIGWTDCDINFKEYSIGDKLPWGFINTLKIIQHRNTILDDSNINKEVPRATQNTTEYNRLLELISNIMSSEGTDYQQFYYPHASLCYAYEPAVDNKAELAECFKANNWWLPSAGEFARIIWYLMKSNEKNTEFGIFTKPVEDGIMESLVTNYVWCSSTEVNNELVSALRTNTLAFQSNQPKSTILLMSRAICAF